MDMVNVRYELKNLIPIENSYQLFDRSINIITNPVFSSTNTIKLLLPESKGNSSRDFLIKILVPDQSSYTVILDGGVYYSDDQDIFTLDAGFNIIPFTEINNNEFMISKKVISQVADFKPYWGLTFIAKEAGSKISMQSVDGPEVNLQTSFDGETWTPFIVGDTEITLENVGDKVYFAATDDGNETFGIDNGCAIGYVNFLMTGKLDISGDISSLLNNKNSVTDLTGRYYCFTYLFLNCSAIINTSKLLLPATTLVDGCYNHMFIDCTSLTSSPELPYLIKLI